MKRRRVFIVWLCVLTMCLLVSGQAFAENNASSEGFLTGRAELVEPESLHLLKDSDVDALNAKMQEYVPAEDVPAKNDAPVFYYYEQLEPIEQEMYDIMLMIAQDPVEENIGVMMTDQDPSSEAFFGSFCRAYYAMTYDHPEFFWLYYCTEDQMYFSSDVITRNGIYIVYFHLEETYEDYEEKTKEFNQAAEAFLANINTNTSQYNIARQIHDNLIELVEYNHPVCDEGRSDLAHTAYGALVQDSQGHKNLPVCDGYSLAYIYLLQQCGIEAVYIGGVGGPDTLSASGHAWNIIKLDGSWYEVDSTWDDTILENDISNPTFYETQEALSDISFFNKLSHHLFLISTDRMTNFVPDKEFYTYYSSAGWWLQYNPGGVHIRDTADCFEALMDPTVKAIYSVMDLAPIAENDYLY